MATTRQESDACTLLDADHKAVKKLFKECDELVGSPPRGHAHTRVALAHEICHELTVHTAIEEGIFYPALREALMATT